MRNLTLLIDLYQLTMMYGYWKSDMKNDVAVFDMFYRKPCESMNYAIMAGVEQLIDYYYRPEVAAEVAAWVNYITPVQGAQEAMEEIDPELAENPLIFPTPEYLAQTRVFRTLTPAEEERYNGQYLQVIGA